jgi:hypothetical protein
VIPIVRFQQRLRLHLQFLTSRSQELGARIAAPVARASRLCIALGRRADSRLSSFFSSTFRLGT